MLDIYKTNSFGFTDLEEEASFRYLIGTDKTFVANLKWLESKGYFDNNKDIKIKMFQEAEQYDGENS